MKTILLVDDSIPFMMLLSQILEPKYRIVTRSNGLEVVDWLQKGNIPDLILTDLKMPQMDGLELLKTLRNSGIFSGIPVMVVSASEQGDRLECFRLGAVDFLGKPFDPEELLLRIDKIVN